MASEITSSAALAVVDGTRRAAFDFCLWHKADVATAQSDVCCLGKSGSVGDAPILPLVTQSGLSGSA
jgi:hypothetical protein